MSLSSKVRVETEQTNGQMDGGDCFISNTDKVGNNHFCHITPLCNNRHHLTYDTHLEVKIKYYYNCSCCIVQDNCAQ